MLTATHPEDPFVDMNYVGSQFNRSPRTIRDWIKSGVIPEPTRINGYKAWRRSQIDAVVDKFEQTAR